MALRDARKMRKDNQTGITGISKYVYPESSKRKPAKYIVQFRCQYICITKNFKEAVKRRWEAEKKDGMYAESPFDSTAYQYLINHNLIKGE